MNDIHISLPLDVAENVLDTLNKDSIEYYQLSDTIARTRLSEQVVKYWELERKYNREIERGDTLQGELLTAQGSLALANYRLKELGAARAGEYISPSSIVPFAHEGGYILTIKEVRTRTNCGLIDAKKIVDMWLDEGLVFFPEGKGRGGK